MSGPCYLRRVSSPFEGRALAYAKYRSPYPAAAIERVVARAGLGGAETVADLGSGTGLLSGALLKYVRRLYAVEPAGDMRRAAEAALGDHPAFHSVAGTAEATSLAAASVDAVTSGNAFHYFEPGRARREVDRILRSGGRVVLLFNDWPRSPQGFTRDYQDFLDRITPPELRSTHADSGFATRLAHFLDGREPSRDEGEHVEAFSWQRLAGRFASTSIAPAEGDAAHDATYAELRRLFDLHEQDGAIAFALRWTCLSVVWS